MNRSHIYVKKNGANVLIWYFLNISPQISNPHRITPNIKDWFRCSNHPTNKSTNGYPDPDMVIMRKWSMIDGDVNVDNGDHEEGVNDDDNALIMTNTEK